MIGKLHPDDPHHDRALAAKDAELEILENRLAVSYRLLDELVRRLDRKSIDIARLRSRFAAQVTAWRSAP